IIYYYAIDVALRKHKARKENQLQRNNAPTLCMEHDCFQPPADIRMK
ncbi:unnamed protein product, partial [Didymodactylos carnosus]